jgi:hypothetical protein
MGFQQPSHKGAQKTGSVKRVGMVDHKVAGFRDFRSPEFDLCRVDKQYIMAEGMQPFFNRLRTAAGSIDRMDNRNSHDVFKAY